jgi:hypothetical protein
MVFWPPALACIDFSTASFSAFFRACRVMADRVPRVVMTSGLSVTSITVPVGAARARSNAGSNSAVWVMRSAA